VPAAPRFAWTPFGYLRGQLNVVRDDPDVAFVGRSDGFSLQHARLGVRGALGERVSFEVSFDGAVDERDRVNTTNGRLRVGLRDAFVDFHRPTRAAFGIGPDLSVRAGRFEAWFDPDGIQGDTERPFIDRALESHGVSASEGWETAGLPPGRSIGAAVRVSSWNLGSFPEPEEQQMRLLAEVALMNGAGEFASNNDNDDFALSAALRLAAGSRGWAQVAYRRNPRTEGELPFRQEEVDDAFSLGGGLALGPLELAAGGILQYTRFATTGGPRQRAWGAHGQAMARILDGKTPLRIGYRFAILDPSSLVVSDRLMEHTAGVVWTLASLRTRLLLDVTHAVEEDQRELTNDRVELVVELRL
jgi:Phosphate-selective porin O and P